MPKVRERVCVLLKGCKCSTGQKIGFVDVQKRAVNAQKDANVLTVKILSHYHVIGRTLLK